MLRQDYLRIALEWVTKSTDNDAVDAYMSKHRYDTNINELKAYFTSVIDWISGVFTDVESEMRGLEWGRLFETYHNNPYDPVAVSAKVHELYADGAVKKERVSLNTYWVAAPIPACLKSVFLKKAQRKRSIHSKVPLQRQVENQTVRFVH